MTTPVNRYVKRENESAIEVSCSDHLVTKSALKIQNVSIIIDEAEFRCGNLIHKVEELSGVHRITSHNVLESIADLMIYWRRPKAVFIFDSYSGFLPQQASNYLQKRSIKHKLINLEDSSEISSQLFNSTYYQTENFVIVCHSILLHQLINEIVLQNLLTKNLTWIIVSDSTPKEIIGEDIPPNSQVTLMVPNTLTPSGHISSSVQETGSIDNVWQNSNFTRWTGINEDELAENVAIILNNRDKEINLQCLTTNQTETIKFADWNVSRSNKLIMIENFNDKDKLRLRGRRVRVVVFEHLPYSILSQVNGSLHVEGYLRDMIGTLLTHFNARFTIREIKAVFGIGINGTYTGMVGMFYRRETDMAMNILAMTNSRASAVTYAGPVTKAYVTFMYMRPPAIIPPTTYLMPFDVSVWIAAFVLLILFMFTTVIIFSTSPSINNISKQIHKWSFRTFTFTLIEEVMEYPPGAAAKVIHGTFLLATFITFIHYTTTFTAFLTYQEENIPFADIHDVVRKKEYKVLVTKNSRHQDMLKYAPPGPYLDLWKRVEKQDEKYYMDKFESGYFDLIKTPNSVSLSDGPTLIYVSTGDCSVAFSPAKYMEEYFNTPHRRDFPYSRIFTMGLMKVFERGILRRLTLAYRLVDRAPCTLENTGTSFGLNQVQGIFLLFALGIVMSLLVLTVERQLPKRLPRYALKTK
ncbi:hypothetical protein CHUAL_009724 [Chamberlinius hualienensis]